MTKKPLNLNEFNITNEKILEDSQIRSKKKNEIRKRKENKLAYKMQVGLTECEYKILLGEFNKSGFTSFSGFLRMQLKKIKFI